MDLTNFIVVRRNDALLVGDYGSYRKQLSRRILTLRRKLGRASPKGRKYIAKAPITAEDVLSNHEFIDLLVLTSERAWAHAMYMKSMHSADSAAKSITGSTRKHIISRLNKAVSSSAQLVELSKALVERTAESRILIEARAYHSLLRGVLDFESQKWENSLEAYSEVHVIYTALAKPSGVGQDDSFRDLLLGTVDPSIRYAAYQLRLPRTLSIESLVSRFLPKSSEDIRKLLNMDPIVSQGDSIEAKGKVGNDTNDLPKTITWRSRVVKLEDANIAQALASVSIAEQKLASVLSDAKDMTSKDKAIAYDEVLIPSQDAVDATKTAIDELTSDGVAQSDQRMQALQITRTAVNYALVGWRIGRNRVLCGKGDGALMDFEVSKKRKRPSQDHAGALFKEESNGRKLARLRERVVLYDTTLQSLDSIRELPGVASDQPLLDKLESTRSYFAALRCLSIAYSHSLLDNKRNALALLSRASKLASRTTLDQPNSIPRTEKPPHLDVTPEQLASLQKLLQALLSQHHALLEVHNLSSDMEKAAELKDQGVVPLIERLDEYPANGADLSKLVIYPPRLRPIPVKPLFLDVAWNYIEYPGRSKVQGTSVNSVNGGQEPVETNQGRRGWFSFR